MYPAATPHTMTPRWHHPNHHTAAILHPHGAATQLPHETPNSAGTLMRVDTAKAQANNTPQPDNGSNPAKGVATSGGKDGGSGGVRSFPFDLKHIGNGLPVADCVDEFLRATATNPTIVVEAPPGTGKSTLIPPLLANILAARTENPANSHEAQKVVVVAPRRVAVRSAAGRLQQLHRSVIKENHPGQKQDSAAKNYAGEDSGPAKDSEAKTQATGSGSARDVGYAIRGETQAGRRVEFVTPGVLLRRLLADPELDGVGAVVLDEVHERQLDVDVLLAMLRELALLREDFLLVAMSATIDASRFASFLEAPVMSVAAATYPVEVEYAPHPGRVSGDRREFWAHVAKVAARELMADPQHSVLVFAPGVREVESVCALVDAELQNGGARAGGHGGAASLQQSGARVVPLHGRQSSREQDAALRPGGQDGAVGRVIVATSIAESSVTVPGVRTVVDSGLARVPRRDAGRGMSGLVTLSAARSSMDQRAGRAGREAPGRVVRCMSEAEYAQAAAFNSPEISTRDLTDARLQVACWGPVEWFEAPPQVAWQQAEALLVSLGALAAKNDAGVGAGSGGDSDGSGVGGGSDADLVVTSRGRRMAAIPADPRIAGALLSLGTDAARWAAVLTAQPSGDVARWVPASAAERKRIDKTQQRFEALVRKQQISRRDQANAPAGAQTVVGKQDEHGIEVSAGLACGFAYPGQLARLIEGSDGTEYLLASGTRVRLPTGDRGFSNLVDREWLAVVEVSLSNAHNPSGRGGGSVTSVATVRSAASLSEKEALWVAEQTGMLSEEVVAEYNSTAGRLQGIRERRVGAIILNETRVQLQPDEAAQAVAAAIRTHGLALFEPLSDAAQNLRERMAFIQANQEALPGHHHGAWPDVSELNDGVGEIGGVGTVEEWLAPELQKIADGTPVKKIDLLDAFRRLLPWPQATELDTLAPERWRAPSGNTHRVDYSDPTQPKVSCKLQECFGLAESPVLCGQTVLFELLSPAGRPLAITGDLRSFWDGPYSQVRSEMRGRYPKHPWPEDPWAATATSLTKKRLEGRT